QNDRVAALEEAIGVYAQAAAKLDERLAALEALQPRRIVARDAIASEGTLQDQPLTLEAIFVSFLTSLKPEQRNMLLSRSILTQRTLEEQEKSGKRADVVITVSLIAQPSDEDRKGFV